MTQNSILLIDGNRGIYIPKFFVENYGQYIKNRKKVVHALGDLGDPNNEFYWDSWETVLDEAVLSIEGKEYRLYQDQDLWAVPVKEYEQISEL